MKVTETSLPGVFLVEPDVFGDARGWFMESWSARKLAEFGINNEWVQDNHSYSAEKGILRGLHYQLNPSCQAKIVRATRGTIFDVAVDIRKGSPTFGKYVAVELTEDNHRQLFVPRGFAHGFSVLSEEVIFQYKCDNLYAPESEGAIAWNDPDVGIDWQIPAEDVLLSAKDSAHPMLKDATDLFDYNVDYYAE